MKSKPCLPLLERQLSYRFAPKDSWPARTAILLLTLAPACSSPSNGGPSSGGGGEAQVMGSGGQGPGVGGNTVSSGGGSTSPATGGSPSSGGATSGGGGVLTTGGNAGSGGESAAGGAETTGGNGGVNATGGSGGSGGASGSGGVGATGGSGGSEPEILGARPPMGWNSWNTFGCNISEALVKQVADLMASNGMREAGYEYVNMDDCWMYGRDQQGKLQWQQSTFPSGIPALAEYVHSKGLKLGIYESAHSLTCVGVYSGDADKNMRVGSLGHEEQDAATFAEWGIDYLKYDLCTGQRASIIKMGEAIRNQDRPIVYSINPGNGQNDLDPPKPNWDMNGVANLWRIGFDINASWDAVIRLIDENSMLYPYAAPGAYNDPDMLEVGKLANDNEDRAHFALWAIMAAPLIAGNDLSKMTAATKEILLNEEIIAVDQDPKGIQGRIVATPGQGLQVWSKEMSGDNVRAVVLFNRGGGSANITVNWSDLGLPSGAALVRDLWTHTDVGTLDDSYTAMNVPSHGAAMVLVTSSP